MWPSSPPPTPAKTKPAAISILVGDVSLILLSFSVRKPFPDFCKGFVFRRANGSQAGEQGQKEGVPDHASLDQRFC
jgi:hypothetical protein